MKTLAELEEELQRNPIGQSVLNRTEVRNQGPKGSFDPVIGVWPGGTPMTQREYDGIVRYSQDLFNSLGNVSPSGATATPSRMAASMRKGSRPPPRTFREAADAPNVNLVPFGHESTALFGPTKNNPLGEFDFSFMGKGEGAQAFGPGVYVWTNPAVGQDYARRFTRNMPRMPTPELEAMDPRMQMAIKLAAADRSVGGVPRTENVEDYLITLFHPRLGEKANRTKTWDEWDDLLEKVRALPPGKSLYDYMPRDKPYSYRGALVENPERTLYYDTPIDQLPKAQFQALMNSSSMARAALARRDPHPYVAQQREQAPLTSRLRNWIQPELLPGHPVFDQVANENPFAIFKNAAVDRNGNPIFPPGELEYQYNKLIREEVQRRPYLRKQLQQEANLAQRKATLIAKDPNLITNPTLGIPVELQDGIQKLVRSEYEPRSIPRRTVAPIPEGLWQYFPSAANGYTDSRSLRDITGDASQAGTFLRDLQASPSSLRNLREAGIDLIKFLDGNSRRNGVGTYNYIVTNPSVARINERGRWAQDSTGKWHFAPEVSLND